MADSAIDLRDWTEALEIFKAAPLQWALLFTVYTLIAAGTLGLGLVFVPNVMRMMRDALAAHEAPPLDFGRMFDTSNLQEDATAVVVFTGAVVLCGSFLGPLTAVVGAVLGFVNPLVADGRPAVESIQTSAKWVMANPVEMTVHVVIANVILLPAICCFPLFPVALPIGAIASWRLYERHKDEMFALTDSAQT
jgi:uncharacterized membrane protein